MGVTATINHSIDGDTAEYLVIEFEDNCTFLLWLIKEPSIVLPALGKLHKK